MNEPAPFDMKPEHLARLAARPGPPWRRGVVFWQPTGDGREVVVYPQLFGAGQVCLGPIDPSDIGFDKAWMYRTLDEALEAAENFDPETQDRPSGDWVRGPDGKRSEL